MESRSVKETQIIETTVGDLIETLTAIAMNNGQSQEESYTLASLALEKILEDSGKTLPNLNF